MKNSRLMERRMTGNCHVRCEAGEKGETASNPYLSLFELPHFFFCHDLSLSALSSTSQKAPE